MKETIPGLSPYMEPTPVGFTFDAPGWYTVGLLLALAVITAVILWIRHYYHNRYRRLAIRLIEENEKIAIAGGEYSKLVYNANMIAKQICIRLYGRKETAPLKDAPWIIFLNRSSGGNIFSSADAQIIRDVYYPMVHTGKQQALHFTEKIKQWIKKHHSRL